MLFEEVTRSRVPVSLATVYNTLHQFTEAGLLRQLAVDGSKAYFDTNPTEHHHFFIEGDDELIDVPADGVAVGALPEPPEGMEIAGRSEEHTSELQSRQYLVCRLLLEKKKK